MAKNVTTPEEFFGFKLGSDRKIARWDKIVEYFMKIGKQSKRVKVIEMGPSTEGHPFLAVIITSEENMKNLDRIREINQTIADPCDATEEEIQQLVTEGKAVTIQSMSLHASEIGGTQMSPELAYDLITREDEESKRIRENVVSIIIPSFNPDGQVMVADWYKQWLDTEYEGVGTPFLYHKYCGHDNNRDAFATNLVESQYMAKLMFKDWPPHAYQDHHHMGSYGARLYVAPYSDPIHPHGDPLVWRELSWYGAHMAYKLEEAGKTGILNAAVFSGWAHLGFHWIGIYHNIPSMLTESASAKLATPLYIHPEQLKEETKAGSLVGTRMFPHYKPTTNFPHPWPGGWWRLRDIVEQQKVSAWALLDQMARNKETVLWNAYRKATRQTEVGAEDSPAYYIIPSNQHDPRTSELLIEKLMTQGVKIFRAKDRFLADGCEVEKGSYLIPLSQPKRGLLHTLLGTTRFPDDSFTRQLDGSPHRPYDTATDTMAEFMGVGVLPVDFLTEVEVDPVEDYKPPKGSIDVKGKSGYLIDTRENHAYKVVNKLMDEGVKVWRLEQVLDVETGQLPPGCFIVDKGHDKALRKITEETGIDLHPLEELQGEKKPVKRSNVGLFRRYWGGNMDEGWTRLCLEQYGFKYTTIMDKDILEGGLSKIDVLILPSDSAAMILGGDELKKWWKENRPDMEMPNFPPEYRSGIGNDGKQKIRDWVNSGGRLICLGESGEFAIDALDLKVANVLKGVSNKVFHCPGSTLHVNVDICHPLGFGMPEEALALFWSSPAYKIVPNPENHKYHVVATFPDSNLLESGWLIGEEKIANKIAMLDVEVGKGKAVLIGIRCQHRCQTNGTFKLLFNALLG